MSLFAHISTGYGRVAVSDTAFRLFAAVLAFFYVGFVAADWGISVGGGGVMLAGLLLGWSALHDDDPHFRRVSWGLLAFVAGGIVSLWNNDNWAFAGWRFERYYPFLLAPLVIAFLRPFGTRVLRILLVSAAVASIVLLLLALFEIYVRGESRIGVSIALNPNRIGEIAFLFLLLLLNALLYLPLRLPARVAAVACGIAAGYAGTMTGSRNAVLMFLVAAVVSGVLWLRAEARHMSRRGALTVWGVLVTCAMLAPVTLNDELTQRLSTLPSHVEGFFESGDYNTSEGIRLGHWEGAFKILAEHPLIGTGLGDARDDLARLIASGESGLGRAFTRFHSVYADAAATTGLLGIVTLWVGLFLMPGWVFSGALDRTDPWERFAAVSGITMLVYYALMGFASSWLFNRGMPGFYVTLLVLLGAVLGRRVR